MALARSLHPSAGEAELVELAAAAYTKAGVDLLVLTVQTTKRLRPNAAGVGFYGLPRPWRHCQSAPPWAIGFAQ